MYFKQFADCICVQGVVRSVIYDLGRSDFKFVPNEIYDILTHHNTKTVDEIKSVYHREYDDRIDEYFDFLLENEFVFYCSKEELDLFPPISTEYDIPALISNAIIDTNLHSNHDYEDIFNQLTALHCRFIQLRFYTEITLSHLKGILNRILNKGIRGVDVILPLSDDFNKKNIEEIIFEFPVVKLEFHSVDEQILKNTDLQSKYNIPVLFTKEKVTDATHCGVVSPIYFQVNKDLFLESQHFNSCLYKKISIDVNGNIRNCPSLPISYGNVKGTSLLDVINSERFKKVWSISKDKINVCKFCEFRYMCTDCRAYVTDLEDEYSKPLKCNYDPFTGKWV